jgi:Protein of unknown function (DUF3551)
MRVLTLAILLIDAVSVASHAQTYDPHYPICLQSYSLGGGRIDCSYTSLAQRNASASGRGGQCLTSPFLRSRIRSRLAEATDGNTAEINSIGRRVGLPILVARRPEGSRIKSSCRRFLASTHCPGGKRPGGVL